MRFLNGFILIGLILFFISIAGLASGNRLLAEPGQPVNPYAWLEYLAAAAIMLVNGAVTIRMSRSAEKNGKAAAREKPADEAAPAADSGASTPRPDSGPV